MITDEIKILAERAYLGELPALSAYLYDVIEEETGSIENVSEIDFRKYLADMPDTVIKEKSAPGWLGRFQ